MILDLRENSPDRIWKNILSKKARNKIRHFEKDEFAVSTGISVDRLKTFYRYYRENLLHQGGSPFPFSHFEQIVKTYGENEVVLILLARGPEVAGGLLTFVYPKKKTMYAPYASINRKLPSRYTTLDYMCWDTVKRAAEMGVEKLSFGYAPPNPNHPDFVKKQRFGCKYEGYRSLFFPTSSTFKFAYSAYGLLKRFVAK
jgi:predicted N-acyltransferase